jgi:hypothetical protein
MIPVDNLLYKLQMKLNRVSTNFHQDIFLEDKIMALNEAQMVLIKNKFTGGPESLGLDGSSKRYHDLENLIVNYNTVQLKEGIKGLGQYYCNVSDFSPPFLYWVDGYVTAKKNGCIKRLWVNKDLVKHGDIQFILSNPDLKPSFEYEEVPCTIAEDKIFIYSDGTFEPQEVHVSYIKIPRQIDKEGYIRLDGTPSENVDCELRIELEDELVDLAWMFLGMYTENAGSVSMSQAKMAGNQ